MKRKWNSWKIKKNTTGKSWRKKRRKKSTCELILICLCLSISEKTKTLPITLSDPFPYQRNIILKIYLSYHWKRWGAILPSWFMLYECTAFALITVGWLASSTGSWVIWIRLLTMKRGLFVRSTSSFRDIPSKYCFSSDFNIWLSFPKASFCFLIAKRSRSTLLCLLKKLFRYLNSSYSSGVSYWNWFLCSSEISLSSTVVS